MPILTFVVFVTVGVLAASMLGHSLSVSEKKERPVSRRCRRPHEVHRRRLIRRQRERCRLEG
jgi:hypothetical protein